MPEACAPQKFCAKLPTSAFAQNVQFPNFLCAVAVENCTIAQICATFVIPDIGIRKLMLLDSNVEYAVINTKKIKYYCKDFKEKRWHVIDHNNKAALGPLQILNWGKKGDEAK